VSEHGVVSGPYQLSVGPRCGDGFTNILSPADCTNAAALLGLPPRELLERDNELRPLGCYFHQPRQILVYNSIGASDSTAAGRHALCREVVASVALDELELEDLLSGDSGLHGFVADGSSNAYEYASPTPSPAISAATCYGEVLHDSIDAAACAAAVAGGLCGLADVRPLCRASCFDCPSESVVTATALVPARNGLHDCNQLTDVFETALCDQLLAIDMCNLHDDGLDVAHNCAYTCSACSRAGTY